MAAVRIWVRALWKAGVAATAGRSQEKRYFSVRKKATIIQRSSSE